jgi:hypothetical protein
MAQGRMNALEPTARHGNRGVKAGVTIRPEQWCQGRERFMKRLGLIVGLLAVTSTAAGAQTCVGSFCGRIVVAAGANDFDGTWSETITGGPKCAATLHTTFQVANGQLIQSGCSGVISPSGSVQSSCNGAGFTLTATGHFTPNSASGRYTRSDGCSGSWKAVKQ